jgi:hypothetical protein
METEGERQAFLNPASATSKADVDLNQGRACKLG